MKLGKVILLIILFFFAIAIDGVASDKTNKKFISTSEWIFEVTSFASGLQEAKLDQQGLYSTKQNYFKNKQFIRVDGILRPALKNNKYTFGFKLKLNGKQNLILVEMVDKMGKRFAAIGDDAKFDRSRNVEFKSNQFPMKMGICFYLPADIHSFKFSIDDSAQINLGGM